MKTPRKSRPIADYLKALAYCVESLSIMPLCDSIGAIRAAVELDERIWNHLDCRTKQILTEGAGLTDPTTTTKTP